MTTLTETLRMAALTCARLCDELSGSLASLDQALTQVGGGGEADEQSLSQARAVAGTLQRRIRLLRAACDPRPEALTYPALRGLAGGLPGIGQLRIDFSRLDDAAALPPALGQMVLNMVLLADYSLPVGGTIMLSGSSDEVFILIDGPGAAWPSGLFQCLADADAARAACEAADDPRMALTAMMAHALGVRVSPLLAGTGTPVPPVRLAIT